MVELLLDITFGAGLFVAFMHVANRRFIAPVYDVVANLAAFVSACAASALMAHWVASALAASAVGCWVLLAWRTADWRRKGHAATGQTPAVTP